jgi:hypothetical protein
MDSSKKASHPFMYHDLLDALNQPGCPVCRLSSDSVRRYLDGLFYEFVNDPVARDSLLNSHGFCAEHAGLLLETRIADALGASMIYKNIVKIILENFPKSSSESILSPIPNRSKERARLIRKFISASSTPGRCPACETREAASDRALEGLSKSLDDENLRIAYQGSDGLCFPHLTQLIERTQGTDMVKFLLSVTQKKLETLQSEMDELIRKNDYRFQSEGITDREGLAWRKAMRMVSGGGANKT